MIISVVVPKLQKAQWERIDEEFKDIEYEMVPVRDTSKALSIATGRFIVFLEEDSAFEPGSLRRSLELFMDNPSYRKLSMIATTIDFDCLDGRHAFSYDEGVELNQIDNDSDHPYPVSIGYFYGSVMRTSAYKKAVLSFKKDALYRSIQISDFLWSNGLRIELNPTAIYYVPAEVKPSAEGTYRIKSNSEALKVWNREFIL